MCASAWHTDPNLLPPLATYDFTVRIVTDPLPFPSIFAIVYRRKTALMHSVPYGIHCWSGETVDALRSGRSGGNPVEVQVLSPAQMREVGVVLDKLSACAH